MKMIFPGKNGRVTFLHSSSSTTIPSFGKILRREIPELLRTDTRTDGRTDTSLSQAVAQLKLRTAASLKAQVSTLVPFKPSHLQTIRPSYLRHNKLPEMIQPTAAS